jgi:hypothetical protein
METESRKRRFFREMFQKYASIIQGKKNNEKVSARKFYSGFSNLQMNLNIDKIRFCFILEREMEDRSPCTVDRA